MKSVSLLPALLSLMLLVGSSAPPHQAGWGPERVKQISGYLDVNNATAHIFFWMFESRVEPSTSPLVLWMTGGPGCSSELAVFYEQGPYRIGGEGIVTLNENSWIEHANVIFVDQPVGTGFSYADNADDYVRDETQVAEDMYEFMQSFYEHYPAYKHNPFFVTGESYAGHYVPAVSNRIFKGNEKKQGFIIPLHGLAIGNGMVNAQAQYRDYVVYAEQKKLITNKAVLAKMKLHTEMCEEFMKHNSPMASSFCSSIISSIQSWGGNFNVYDVREKCAHGPLCYDFSPLDVLMKDAALLKALGVNTEKAHWTECDSKVYAYLQDDWFLRCDAYLPEMLEAGINVLVYSGVEDFICNYIGGHDWSSNMEWSGQSQFNDKSMQAWRVDGEVAGRLKSYDSLTFIEVDGAGHMVPMDQPRAALQMLKEFTNRSTFKQPTIAVQ